MQTKKILWIVIPVLALVGVGVAGAGYRHFHGHHNPEHMVERISDKLDLNDEQKQKLEAVKDALLKGRQDLLQERAEVMDQLIEEIRKPEIDQAQVLTLIEERKSAIDTMTSRVLEPMIEFHKSLNDTQREKIINRLESIRDWGPRHG